MSEDIPDPPESFEETPYPIPPEQKRRKRKYKYDFHTLNKLAVHLIGWVEENVGSKKSFLLTDWCMENGFNRASYTKNKGVSALFDDAWQYAKDWQEHMLVKGALYKKLNVRFVIFMLQCHHGWRPENYVDPRETALAGNLEQFSSYMKAKVGEEPTRKEINEVLKQAKKDDEADRDGDN